MLILLVVDHSVLEVVLRQRLHPCPDSQFEVMPLGDFWVPVHLFSDQPKPTTLMLDMDFCSLIVGGPCLCRVVACAPCRCAGMEMDPQKGCASGGKRGAVAREVAGGPATSCGVFASGSQRQGKDGEPQGYAIHPEGC